MANIIVYGTPSCPWCHRATDFFKELGVDFTYYDVSVNHEKAQEMMEKSRQMGVPVIDIDGNIIVGFDVARIQELLK